MSLPPLNLSAPFPDQLDYFAKIARVSLSLERMEILLAHLHHPEKALPPVVHVAGTNGKGSTIACLRALLEAGGLKVHTYTSPSLIHLNERIRLAGELVSPLLLEDRLQSIMKKAEEIPKDQPTFFEALTATAFSFFADTKADILLLEVGMGGRYDATNVVTSPLCSVITPITYDHQSYLGDTLGQIAFEKAGIIKPGVPVLSGVQEEDAWEVLDSQSQLSGSPLSRFGKDFWVEPATEPDIFLYCSQKDGEIERLPLPRPNLLGEHQVQNAALALATLEQIKQQSKGQLSVSSALYGAALQKIDWPGRLQSLKGTRVHTLFPKAQEIWLDGGHNPHASQALAQVLAQWREKDLEKGVTRPLLLIWGMKKDKEPQAFLEPLLPFINQVITVPLLQKEVSQDPLLLERVVASMGIPVSASTHFKEALLEGQDSFLEEPRVLITGSLYLAGEVLAFNQ